MVKVENLKDLGFEMIISNQEEIIHGYTCDLLSEVMGKAKANTVWITVQSHVNIVAVAVITGIKAIILCDDRKYESETIDKAKSEGIALFITPMSAFEASGKIYELGIR